MAFTEFPPLLSHEEMKKHKIPLGYRDRCAALLVPLNKCRIENYYLPWKCTHERHIYEECQYFDFLRRVKQLDEKKAELRTERDIKINAEREAAREAREAAEDDDD
ncbi:NADH dehydrogenase [ubiquinone] 1 beta subcomplex subunit 7 ASCRUDRAFT_74706 [Ascoidea rubescens DSM 1968]|uniref:NADH dehydrogenase [ubiquinone] 1 beta subcomplex subunit 7 n=1 Tax=Ascoidea rubescens DSM 1968 TaxID=1344418 RepID=A0A1D2VL03_9ASCO|nr:hypothetical protein ASCRUDRAFT_74706 [Ascoidea rubescens DSM 1968]ODV62286.1 hypothetical protein ASCRUDRAFT_74706 [Ascoidea rubescens DSM 1968]